MFGFLKNKKDNKVLVIDLRDGSVGGMIISINKSRVGVPEKIYSLRKELSFQRNLSFKRLFYSTAQVIPHLALSVQKFGLADIDEVHCIVGHHFYFSETMVIRAKFADPRYIGFEMVSGLVEKEIENAISDHPTNKISGSDPYSVVLDKKIMQIKLNGYETDNPFGKTARELRISLFLSLIPKFAIRDLNKIISNNFHKDKIYFHSSSFVNFDSIRGLDIDKDGFVVISVDKETTDISVVRDGILEESTSVPMGSNSLKRSICERFKTIPEEADTYIKMFLSDSADSGAVGAVYDFIRENNLNWKKCFQQAVRELSDRHLLPEHFYVTSDKQYLNLFSNLIRESEVAEMLTYNKPPFVRKLDESVFENYCKNRSDCPDDIHFVTAAVYVNKIFRDRDLTLF